MKVLLSTTWGKEYDELCSIISPENLKYCRCHGYDYNVHHAPFGSPGIYYNVDFNLVLGLMDYYDLIVTLDSDVLIMNHTKRIEDILGNADQVIAEENLGPGCSPINAGVVLWRCCECSRRLIKHLFAHRKEAEKDPRNWQQQIAEMIFERDPLVIYMKVVKAGELNAWGGVGKPPSYKSGDFAVHYYCLPYQKKIDLAKKHVREIKS
jgi:hypothetical protein